MSRSSGQPIRACFQQLLPVATPCLTCHNLVSFWLYVRLLSTVFRPRTSFPLTKYSRINGHVLNRQKTVNLRPDHNFRSPFFPPFYLVNIPIAAELNEPALHLLVSSADTCVPARVEDFSPWNTSVLCYVSPIVVDKCSVVTCKCTCNMDEGLQKAWNEVCRTRDACDKALQGLYSKWIEMSIMNPYYESIGWIRKPDFDIIFCRSTKCGLFL